MTTLEHARAYTSAGISVIPIRADGSKAAAVPWKEYQQRIATDDELRVMFANGCGIAAIAGHVSGDLEVLDFESGAPFDEWFSLIENHAPAVASSLVIVGTPSGGHHVFIRCTDGIEGNQKLAMFADGKVSIETRGQGGYVLTVGSPTGCHSAGRPYTLLQGDLIPGSGERTIPTITAAERSLLLDAARSFNQIRKNSETRQTSHENTGNGGTRPGDIFNQRASWKDVLIPHGWTVAGHQGDETFWRRPGKDFGFSATTNFKGSSVLYVFSSNGAPFEADRSYTKFGAYTLLSHNGDFRAAARAVADKYELPVEPKRTEARSELSLDAAVKTAVEPIGDKHADLLGELHNDYGNGRRIISVSGTGLRYVHALKKFIVWDGRRWAVDSTEQAKKLAALALLEFLRQAIEQKNAAAEKFAKHSLDEKRINAALALARTELSIQTSELDTDPFLLNFQNGTVDVRTGVIQAHDPNHFITRLVHFDYSPEAAAPEFLRFLNRIMGAGPSETSQARAKHLTAFLQRAFGYSLTGMTSEKAVFLACGGGDNGKTTLLETFRYCIDEYAVLLQIDTLMARTHESNNTQSDLADLRGARFVMTSETEEGQRLAEGKLKRITQGTGKIKAVRKYENPIEFTETHKLWMDANHRPAVRGTDNAIWNRLHLIPFSVSIPKDEQDRELAAKLRAEAEGILAWSIAGAQLWWKDGLGKPEEVTEAVAGWRDESDPLKNFIADTCTLNPDSYSQVDQMRTAYGQWCDANGEHPLDSKRFNKRLEALKCEQDRIKISGKQYRIWRGITISVTGDNR